VELNELIGNRIRYLRVKRLKESGETFGQRFEGEPWSRQAVSDAENGKRKFGVEDLVALARASDQSVQFFLTAPAKTTIELKDGSTLTPSQLSKLWGAPPALTGAYLRKAQFLLRAIDDFEGIQQNIKQLDDFLGAVAKDVEQ
jgi:hypothetical protein